MIPRRLYEKANKKNLDPKFTFSQDSIFFSCHLQTSKLLHRIIVTRKQKSVPAHVYFARSLPSLAQVAIISSTVENCLRSH